MPLSPRVSGYDALLLDLDGCLWLGDQPIEGAAEAVDALRSSGKQLAFITNNPRYAPEDYVRKLWRLGFRASAAEIVTPGVAAEHLLARRGGGSAFVVGSQALVDHVAVAGMRIVNGTDLAPRADVVVVSVHERFVYDELRTATQAVLRGAELIATSRDPTMPMPDGLWPGSGAVIAAVETATGRTADVILGKPEPPLYDAALATLDGGRVLAVGDRLESDIAGAVAAGLDSALVLTGVTRSVEARDPDPAPTFVAPSLAELVLG